MSNSLDELLRALQATTERDFSFGRGGGSAFNIHLSPEKQVAIQNSLSNIRFKETGGDGSDPYAGISESPFKKEFMTTITGNIHEEWKNGQNKFKFIKDQKIDNDLLAEEEYRKLDNMQYQTMFNYRKLLPAYYQKDTISESIRKNKVVLISGEAGCGKTTQVPQYILEDCIQRSNGSQTYIVCTQPRRISAISVAKRVADERGENIGKTSVGYQIQLEKVEPRERGGILFCTTGILLRWMMSDPLLTKVSHIIVDEVHERDTISDFLLTLLRDLIGRRDDLRVVIMSASLNATLFADYFEGCPIIEIPGKMFPIKEYFLEDVLEQTNYNYVPNTRYRPTKQEMKEKQAEMQKLFPYLEELRGKYPSHVISKVQAIETSDVPLELITELIAHIHKSYLSTEGAILVFLTGWAAIDTIGNDLERKIPTGDYILFQLHSLLPTVDQAKIFDRPPPGVRKIILSTSLAETSITIDDVVFVIDCGKIKMGNYDTKAKLSTLTDVWVSKANAAQRKGRAGRVQNGICFRLFTKGRQHLLQPYLDPEIHRTSLEQVILQAKLLKLGKIEPFFTKLMDPPKKVSLSVALELLTNLNALDNLENLTPLGYHLAQMQIEPNLGKMLLLGALFSCFDPVASIVACLSFRDPFPMAKKKEEGDVKRLKALKSDGHKSDHILQAKIVYLWERAPHKGDFCRDHKVNNQTLKHISSLKTKLTERLYDLRFLSDYQPNSVLANVNSNNYVIIKAIICGGLYPNVAVIENATRKGERINISMSIPGSEEKVTFHKKSVNDNVEPQSSRFVTYYKMVKYGRNTQLHDSSIINPIPILFFCKSFDTIKNRPEAVIMKLDNGMKFSCANNLAGTIKELRKLLDSCLEYMVTHPGHIDLDSDTSEARIMNAIVTLLLAEDDEQNY